MAMVFPAYWLHFGPRRFPTGGPPDRCVCCLLPAADTAASKTQPAYEDQTPVKHGGGPRNATRRALRRLTATRSGETASPRRVPGRSPGPGQLLRRAGEDAGVSPERMEHGEAGIEAAKAHLVSPIWRACGSRSFARTAHRPRHHDVLSVVASSLCVCMGLGERRSRQTNRQAALSPLPISSHDLFYSCTLPSTGARESRRLVAAAARRPSSPVPRASVVVWSLRTGGVFQDRTVFLRKPASDVTSPPTRKHTTPRANPSSSPTRLHEQICRHITHPQ